MTLFDLLMQMIQRINKSISTTPMVLSESEMRQARENIGIFQTAQADKDELVSAVIEALPIYDGEAVDE